MFEQIFGDGPPGFKNTFSDKTVEIEVMITLEQAFYGVTKYVNIPLSQSQNVQTKRFELKIPPGISSGEKITYVDKAKYDLQKFICKIVIEPHKIFQLAGRNLKNRVFMSLSQAILGGELVVPTITGKEVILSIPQFTQNGQIFKLKGKGMPYKSNPFEFGDQMISTQVVLPQDMTHDQLQLFKQLGELI